ncbi:hypothetical protein [Pseudomonas chlororaphis]|uniref:hypothetical protein n=1 Tax=Pseudomonas chlororaphis TaxID=587753 RepID=UPI0015DF0D6B|nr:hypothetical protein [Pseudomonas chlororaphis]QLL15371.1 hypothetical protein H0I86_09865 [Pseudomonas chlororaphis subsp. aurantiaca]
MASPLWDLDELVLKCRDEKAKSYIKEAVSCYRSGAFRSAIVSTWVAVAFDIIDKLKELALAGDKAAESQMSEFEKARRAGDIGFSLKFERDLLKNARDQTELISHTEHTDLERLQQDRNRCAHPSMTIDGEIFNPSAELARMHIRSAVEHLLQHPAAQGKYALDLLLAEVDSGYFPLELDKALVALRSSPMVRGRASLIRNFIVVLLKKLLRTDLDPKEQGRAVTALNAVEVMHKEVYDETIDNSFSSFARALEPTHLYRVFPLLTKLTDGWDMLDADIQQKIAAFVEDLPEKLFNTLDPILNFTPLAEFTNKRVAKAVRTELGLSFFSTPSRPLIDRVIELFGGSVNFDQANAFGAVVLSYIGFFSREQIEEIIKVSGQNGQVKYSRVIPAVIKRLYLTGKATDDDVDAWLKAAKMEDYIQERVAA